jgi:hypothetical protein
MKTVRTRLLSSVLLVLLALTVAVQPAMTQSPQPGRAPESLERKPHQKIPAGKDCSSCHTKIYAEWKAGPHGKNGVQCSVCHGNVTEKLTAKVSLSVCGECHSEHALKGRS